MTQAAAFHRVWTGSIGDVRFSEEVWASYREICAGTDERSVKRKRSLERYFEEFCNNEPHRLAAEAFKKQGDYSDGKGKYVAIWEFKAWQWRVYGAVFHVSGKKNFVGVKVDPDKKRDRANKTLLENAAKEIGKLEEFAALDVKGKKNEKRGRKT